jgi:hypothetical protein
MNSVFSPSPASLGLGAAVESRDLRLRSRLDGARGLSTLLAAAAVAAMVSLADRLLGDWADQHLFLAWLALWLVILAGTLAVSGPARQVARRVCHALNVWSDAVDETNAELRLWKAARADHRVMAEYVPAIPRDLDDEAGWAASWGRFPESLADGRRNATHLRHC